MQREGHTFFTATPTNCAKRLPRHPLPVIREGAGGKLVPGTRVTVALGVGETVAGHRLGALEVGSPPSLMHPCIHPPAHWTCLALTMGETAFSLTPAVVPLPLRPSLPLRLPLLCTGGPAAGPGSHVPPRALRSGRRYGLVGPNGKGKSTLLNLLNTREIPVPANMHVLLVSQEQEV